jgi:hypothetical protein
LICKKRGRNFSLSATAGGLFLSANDLKGCSSSLLPDKLQAVQVFAPAKINLSLKILRRRADGFHEIETLAAPISLCDEIVIHKRRSGIAFACDDASVPAGEENLAVRAAALFFEFTKIEPAVSIHLTKKIPHGAGLGGGSSDAAAVLLALNEVFNTRLSRQSDPMFRCFFFNPRPSARGAANWLCL